MAGVFPESEGSQPVTGSDINASCEVREYGDCYRIIDTGTLDAISKEIAHAVNACDNNRYECDSVTNLKETLECIIDKIPDICGAPTVTEANITDADHVVVCDGANLRRINFANFKDEVQNHPCTLPTVTEAGITDNDYVLVCDNNIAKRMSFGNLKDELGGGGGLVAMWDRDYVDLDGKMHGNGLNVQSLQTSVIVGNNNELTFIDPPPAGRYMFVAHLIGAGVSTNPVLAPQYITYSGSGPVNSSFPLNLQEDFIFYVYGPITNF